MFNHLGDIFISKIVYVNGSHVETEFDFDMRISPLDRADKTVVF